MTVAGEHELAANSKRCCPVSSEGFEPACISDIYKEDVNIAIWQRNLKSDLLKEAAHIVKVKPALQLSVVASPFDVADAVANELGDSLLIQDDISTLADMFCCLFDLKQLGLRLSVLDHAMCPRFHVDRVPCRLITTYTGVATQWLPHHCVDRSKLGPGSEGQSDRDSGLYQKTTDIQQLKAGDVALLKGERWVGNEGRGLVHRSPQPENDSKRLILTFDFVD